MKTLKIFLSETTRPTALIFAMYHHLVDLYQVCSNNDPGVKNGPPQASHVLHTLKSGKREKIILSETRRPNQLIFGI